LGFFIDNFFIVSNYIIEKNFYIVKIILLEFLNFFLCFLYIMIMLFLFLICRLCPYIFFQFFIFSLTSSINNTFIMIVFLLNFLNNKLLFLRRWSRIWTSFWCFFNLNWFILRRNLLMHTSFWLIIFWNIYFRFRMFWMGLFLIFTFICVFFSHNNFIFWFLLFTWTT